MKGWGIKGFRVCGLETLFLLGALTVLCVLAHNTSQADRARAVSDNSFVEKSVSENVSVSESVSVSEVKTVSQAAEDIVESQSNNEQRVEYECPYEIGLLTRENMMTAAMSLVGDVRYIWGGGHSGAAYIKGINPVWKQFNDLYPSEPFTYKGKSQADLERNEGFGKCIKPSGSWCPIHGYVRTAFHGGRIYSIDQYINLRKGLFDNIDLDDEKCREMLSTVNYSHGVNVHVLDGLDCSGYVSWIFNQVQNDYKVNTAARYFIGQDCFEPLEIGDDLLPGDIFAWETHIVMIVGKVKDDSKAYVTLEETPNVLRFGVAYYSDAEQGDIGYGKQIASEANALIGGLNPKYEPPHIYCINTVGAPVSSNIVVPVSPNSVTPTNMAFQKTKSTQYKIILTSEVENVEVEGGYSKAYDTILEGAPYKMVFVFMPRGYHGSAQDLGAPNDGDYEFSTIEEKEEGFYGRYYIRLSDNGDGKAGHSADGKKGGFKTRNVYMPRDFAGSMSDFDIPSDDVIDHREVIERADGFYATYYVGKKAPKKEDADEIVDVDGSDEEEDYIDDELDEDLDDLYDMPTLSENRILRVARFIEPFEDEGVPMPDTGISIEDMDAVEIIRHTLDNLPIQMINGYDSYEGELFADFIKKDE